MKHLFNTLSFRVYAYILTLAVLIFGSIAVIYFVYGLPHEERQAVLYTSALQQNMIQKLDDDMASVEWIACQVARQIEARPNDSVVRRRAVRQMITSVQLIHAGGVALVPGENDDRCHIDYVSMNSDSLSYRILNGRDVYDYLDKPWYRQAIERGENFWTEPYQDGVGSRHRTVLSYVIPLKTGHTVFAVMVADMALDDFLANINGLRPYADSYSFLIDKEEKIITPPVGHISSNDFHTLAEVIGPEMSDSDRRRIMYGNSGGEFIRGGEGGFLLIHARLSHIGWTLCSVCPYDSIVKTLGSATFVSLLVLLVGLVLLVVCLHLVVRKAMVPVHQMTAVAYRIAQGHFDTTLPRVKTRDMRQLSDALGYMQQSLTRYLADLEEATRTRQRIESELGMAHDIQMSMVPKTATCDAVELTAMLKPAREVGGDFYDFMVCDRRLIFIVADVSGKGVAAAMVMAITKTLFRSVARKADSPSAIVRQLNETLATDNDANMFVTLLVGILNLDTGRLDCCNAGHTPPLLLTADGSCRYVPLAAHLPIGVMERVDYCDERLPMGLGDVLLLYTDGLTEAEDATEAMFGPERVCQALEHCEAQRVETILEGLYGQLSHFVGSAAQSDDLTLLCFRQGRRSISFRNDVADSVRLHPFMKQVATDLHLGEEESNRLNLAVEEALVNAMQYAYAEGTEGRVELSVSWHAATHQLVFVLTDSGQPFDPTGMAMADPTLPLSKRSIGGLGLFLVRQLMDRVDYERRDGENRLTLVKNYTALPTGETKNINSD